MDDDAMVTAYCAEARRRFGGSPGMAQALLAQGGKDKHGRPLSDATISNWCVGVAQPSMSMMNKIARASGLSLDLMAGLHGEPVIEEAASAKMELLSESLDELGQTLEQLRAKARRGKAAG